jgi:hypothetical protein
MEVTRGTAYGLGLSQFAITLGIVLFTPPLNVNVYVPRAHMNETALVLTGQGVRVHMGMPVLGVSVLAAVFAMVTYKTYEQGLSGQDFQPDVVEQMGMWDILFWVFCLAAHAVIFLIICDPVDVFGVLSCTLLMTHFLSKGCAPKGQNVNLTQENVNLLGYGVAVVLLGYQLTDTRGNGAMALMLVIAVDYFLGIGHTYDRQATIDTVNNCRLFYICAGALGTGLLYAMSSSDGARVYSS